MRRLAFASVLVLAACSNPEPQEGAVLTFQTPEGAMTASRIEVVLASALEKQITDVDNQRDMPGSFESSAVRYYRQRAVGGTVEGMSGLSGFTLRIEPDVETAADETFIPFVFAYEGDALIGVGAVEDANGDPAPVEILPGMVTRYDVVFTGVTPLDADEDLVDRGKARTVRCANRQDQSTWKSGIAWFPVADDARPDGRRHQLRLLLPDQSANVDATDATDRPADLDCDDHPAANNDCDDLRGAYFNGAPESCDGFDMNCDGQRFFPEGCSIANATCTSIGAVNGVRLCDDSGTGSFGACQTSAECNCNNGGTCYTCQPVFLGTPSTQKTACSPQVGKLHLQACYQGAGCTIEVATATMGWRAFVGNAEAGPFSTRVTGAIGQVFIEAKRSGTVTQNAGPIGEIYLFVTPPGGATQTIPVQMNMEVDGTTSCPFITGSSGSSRMTCSP